MTVASLALDQAALLAGAAMSLPVQREPIGAGDADIDVDTKVGVVIALTEGSGQEIDFCIGADKPYEFEHTAVLEILTIGGHDLARRERREQTLADFSAAIAANPTLNGTVDFAEVESPDPTLAERYFHYAATLRLTYTAADALG